MDADGTRDLALLAKPEDGDDINDDQVLVWYGPEPGVHPVTSALAALDGVGVTSLSNDVLVGGGDLDRDGFDALALGAVSYRGDSESGAAFILFGGPPE